MDNYVEHVHILMVREMVKTNHIIQMDNYQIYIRIMMVS